MEEELTLLLKELVERVKRLESNVYDSDNILMKSGLVKVDGIKLNKAVEKYNNAKAIKNIKGNPKSNK